MPFPEPGGPNRMTLWVSAAPCFCVGAILRVRFSSKSQEQTADTFLFQHDKLQRGRPWHWSKVTRSWRMRTAITFQLPNHWKEIYWANVLLFRIKTPRKVVYFKLKFTEKNSVKWHGLSLFVHKVWSRKWTVVPRSEHLEKLGQIRQARTMGGLVVICAHKYHL